MLGRGGGVVVVVGVGGFRSGGPFGERVMAGIGCEYVGFCSSFLNNRILLGFEFFDIARIGSEY